MNTFFESTTANEITRSKRVLHTPSKFARQNLFYVQEAGRLKSLKTHICRRESLDSFLFIIVLSGTGIVTFNNTSYTLKKSDCVLIDCHNLYSHQSSENDPWEIMWIHFNAVNACSYFNSLKELTGDCIITAQNVNDITDIILKTIDSHSLYTNNTAEYVDSKLITDLLTLLMVESSSYDNTSVPSTSSQKLENVKSYIDKSFQTKLSLDELSDRFFISKYHLSREFKAKYGMTIGNYILIQRITFAKKQLRFTNLSIDEISENCGFLDTAYFIKVFKKSENTTPLQYRKLWSHSE